MPPRPHATPGVPLRRQRRPLVGRVLLRRRVQFPAGRSGRTRGRRPPPVRRLGPQFTASDPRDHADRHGHNGRSTARCCDHPARRERRHDHHRVPSVYALRHGKSNSGRVPDADSGRRNRGGREQRLRDQIGASNRRGRPVRVFGLGVGREREREGGGSGHRPDNGTPNDRPMSQVRELGASVLPVRGRCGSSRGTALRLRQASGTKQPVLSTSFAQPPRICPPSPPGFRGAECPGQPLVLEAARG